MPATIDRLIVNSPYQEPNHYWSYDRETRSFNETRSFKLKDGRRRATDIVDILARQASSGVWVISAS